MPEQGDFFGETRSRARKHGAPEALSPAEWRRLEAWAESRMPWLSRGALGAVDTLESYAEECLEYFRASGGQKHRWVETIQTWVRRAERRRLFGGGPFGGAPGAAVSFDEARRAWREPEAWRNRHDRLAAHQARPAEVTPLHPAGGSAHHLRSRRRR